MAKVLLEFGATFSAKNNLGNTPAHVMPLVSDAVSLEFVDLFLENPDALGLENMFGVSAVECIYLWSLSSQQGNVFQAMRNKLLRSEVGGKVYDAFKNARFGLHSLHDARPAAFDDSCVRTSVLNFSVNGSMRTVYAVEPSNFRQDRDTILYLGFCRLLPWSLQESSLRIIALELGVSLLCISSEAVNADALQASAAGEHFFEDLLALIEVLPLPSRLILVDCTYGVGLPILWRLQERLRGVLILNPSWIFKEAFLNTDMHSSLRARAHRLASISECREVDTLVSMLSDFALSPSIAKAQGSDVAKQQQLYEQFRTGLDTAPGSFWSMSTLHSVWNAEKLSQVLSSLPAWKQNVDCQIMLACGSHSPVAAVQEAAFNLQELLPGSYVTPVSNSMWFWQIEGIQQVLDVASLLEQLSWRRLTSTQDSCLAH
eukprot:TRINITY_DN47082_c0_g1_i1.p1 TRINITY_DN47082_c0_g1~~TRINITY_DN47082_c0_g1_i1.p1  ORF type:complete len:488 (+),score=63.93 TRINITY_DN47082_c0_g1_i1:177-1466(+)